MINEILKKNPNLYEYIQKRRRDGAFDIDIIKEILDAKIDMKEEEENILLKNNFYHFCKTVLQEKGFFKMHWSVEMLCEYLQCAVEGKIERLTVSLPRGYGKSTFISELLSAWILLRDPSERLGCFSRALTEDAKNWHRNSYLYYDSITGKRLHTDLHKIDYSNIIYRTNAGGYRKIGSCLASSVGSDMTIAIADDPVDQEHERSEAKQERIRNFFNKSLLRAIRTIKIEVNEEQLTETQLQEYRLTQELEKESINNQKTPRLILTMQRLHPNDPIAYMIDIEKKIKDAGLRSSFEYLALPSIFTEEKKYIFPISKTERIVKEGEYLEAGTLDKNGINKIKAELPQHIFEAQMQQRPELAGGIYIKREQIIYDKNNDMINHLLASNGFTYKIMSIDCANTSKKENDRTACIFAGYHSETNKVYIIDVMAIRHEYPSMKRMCDEMLSKHKPDYFLIERKANGEALFSEYKQNGIKSTQTGETQYINIFPIVPKTNKEERLQSCEFFFENKMIVVPEHSKWVDDYINEIINFPNGAHDDMVDATTMMLNFIKDKVLNVGKMYLFSPQ